MAAYVSVVDSRVHPVLVEEAVHLLAALPAAGVLSAGGGEREVLGQRDGREHLLLLRAEVGGLQADRLLHGGEGEQLQQVVLDDVARGADPVVVAGAAADADVLGHRDLHVVDVVAVPDRLVQLVGEAQRQDVLHRLLAEVVVDAEDRVGGERHLERLVQRPRRGEVAAERLLDDDAAPAVLVRRCHPPGPNRAAAARRAGSPSAGSTGSTRGCPSCRVRRRASRRSRAAS